MYGENLAYKVFELKGMLSSFSQAAQLHDHYNYPLIQKVDKCVNEMVAIIMQEMKKQEEKVVFPQTFALTKNITKPPRFHSKRNA